MEILWNRMQLDRPPNATFRMAIGQFDVKGLRLSLDKVVKDLESQETLHAEAAVLSRLIYRMKSKFRNDKGLKSMSKVNSALLKYLSLFLIKEYKNLMIYVEVEDRIVSLPSRQMVEYVLVRTQGFARLLLRVEEEARHCAHFLKRRMNTGHAWAVALIAYSVVSRIWILSRHLIQKSCKWYNELHRYLNEFQLSGVPWLPKDYEFPKDLKPWLALPWADEFVPRPQDKKVLGETMFKLIVPRETDSEEDLDTKELVDNESNTRNVEDTGEVVSRLNFAKQSTSQRTKEAKKTRKKATEKISREHSTLDDVLTTSDLKILLSKDSYPGLDKLQWNMIRNRIKNLVDKSIECPSETKRSIPLKKAVRLMRSWIACKSE